MFLAALFQVLNHHRAKIYFFVCTPAKKADRMFNKMPAGEWICCGKRKIAEKSWERKKRKMKYLPLCKCHFIRVFLFTPWYEQ